MPIVIPAGIDALCETLGLEKLDVTPSWNDLEKQLPREIVASYSTVSLPREFHQFIRLPRAFRSLQQVFAAQVIFHRICQLVQRTAGEPSRMSMLRRRQASAVVSLLRRLCRTEDHVTRSSAQASEVPRPVCCGDGSWRLSAAVPCCWTRRPRRSFFFWGEDSS